MDQSLQSKSAIFANLKVPFSPLVECVCANPLSRGQSERGCTAAPRFPAIHVGRTWQWIDQAWNVSPDRYWVRRFCCHDTTATGSIAAYSPGNHCTATCRTHRGFCMCARVDLRGARRSRIVCRYCSHGTRIGPHVWGAGFPQTCGE